MTVDLFSRAPPPHPRTRGEVRLYSNFVRRLPEDSRRNCHPPHFYYYLLHFDHLPAPPWSPPWNPPWPPPGQLRRGLLLTSGRLSRESPGALLGVSGRSRRPRFSRVLPGASGTLFPGLAEVAKPPEICSDLWLCFLNPHLFFFSRSVF